MLLMYAFSDEQFLFMKETMYSKDLKDAFPKYAVILQDMQNYDPNRRKPAAKPEFTVPIGPTVLSTPSLNPSQTKCATCSKMFNTTIRHGGGGGASNAQSRQEKPEKPLPPIWLLLPSRQKSW